MHDLLALAIIVWCGLAALSLVSCTPIAAMLGILGIKDNKVGFLAAVSMRCC
jgi:hypothetical protein